MEAQIHIVWECKQSLGHDERTLLQMQNDKMILQHVFHKLLTVRLLDRSEWERGAISVKKEGLIWYTDGCNTNANTGAEVYGHGMRQRFSFSIGQNTTVFQAQVYAIKKAFSDENIKRSYWKRNNYILPASQAVIKPFNNCKISLKLAWDFYQSITIMGECNNVQLLWVPGH
jgi:hypothetical protein